MSATGQTGRWLYVTARRQELAIEYGPLLNHPLFPHRTSNFVEERRKDPHRIS